MKKQEVLRLQKPEKKNKKFLKANRKSVRITVLVFVLVHLAFWATGFIPDQGKYTCSPFRTSQNLSEYKTITLIRWDYSPREKVMELVFDIKDVVYSTGKMEFTAVYNNAKNLDSQIVYNDDGMLILQLYKVPKQSGKKITITFEYTPEGSDVSETKFYNYTGIINEVECLPVLSKEQYYIARQNYDIAYYQSLITYMEDSIEENNISIANIEAEIARLQSGNEVLTTDELLNLNENIDNDKKSIELLQSQNEEYQMKIAEYQEVIAVLEQRKAKYE